jgi:hypothetical protein
MAIHWLRNLAATGLTLSGISHIAVLWLRDIDLAVLLNASFGAVYLLFDFRFLVDHVLARDRVEFFHLQLVGRGALILVGSVEVSCAGTGNHLDFVAHGSNPS